MRRSGETVSFLTGWPAEADTQETPRDNFGRHPDYPRPARVKRGTSLTRAANEKNSTALRHCGRQPRRTGNARDYPALSLRTPPRLSRARKGRPRAVTADATQTEPGPQGTSPRCHCGRHPDYPRPARVKRGTSLTRAANERTAPRCFPPPAPHPRRTAPAASVASCLSERSERMNLMNPSRLSRVYRSCIARC